MAGQQPAQSRHRRSIANGHRSTVWSGQRGDSCSRWFRVVGGSSRRTQHIAWAPGREWWHLAPLSNLPPPPLPPALADPCCRHQAGAGRWPTAGGSTGWLQGHEGRYGRGLETNTAPSSSSWLPGPPCFHHAHALCPTPLLLRPAMLLPYRSSATPAWAAPACARTPASCR
jgi:hypothetical protein